MPDHQREGPLQTSHPPTPVHHISYSIVPHIFHQSSPHTDPSTFNITATNFGLVNRSYPSDDSLSDPESVTQWERFFHYLSTLNAQSSPGIMYKLLFLTRHGQGVHNVAEAFYGTKAWDCYYSLLEGPPDAPDSSNIAWSDAHLTPNGIRQAENLSIFWTRQIKTQKTPVPDLYYSSPLTRAIQTALITFQPLLPDVQRAIEVKELLRERIGLHTCDRRSTLSTLRALFPNPPKPVSFESNFSAADTLFTPLTRESDAAHDARMAELLDDIFTLHWSSDWQVISLTSHGGSIDSVLRVLGHRVWQVSTAGVVPVVVRAERVDGSRVELQPLVKSDVTEKEEDGCVEGRDWHRREWDEEAFWRAGKL